MVSHEVHLLDLIAERAGRLSYTQEYDSQKQRYSAEWEIKEE